MNKLKDSGIPWIEEIPEHWKVASIKNLMFLFSGATPKSDNPSFWGGDIIWITPADYISENHYVNQGRRNITTEGYNSCATTLVPINSLIFSKRAPIGEVVLSGIPLCTNQGCITCIPKDKIHSNYYYYTFRIAKKEFETLGSGTTFLEISTSDFSNFKIPVPPLEEQERISTYLDEKCGEIDELIEVEQQMISDLESYRQAVITETVTHGLNPDVLTKPTAIPWISPIPEQWKEIRLKFLSRISTGDKDTIMANDEGEYPFFVRSPKIERINTYSYDGEAILMAGDGVGAGRVFHHFIGKFDWHQRVYNMHELTYNIYGRFLFYFLLTNFHKLIDAGSAKSTVDSVRLPMLTNFITLVPPLSEQKEISNYLDTKCAEIDELIKVKQEKIETLKQSRQSLIFEAVSGKITIV